LCKLFHHFSTQGKVPSAHGLRLSSWVPVCKGRGFKSHSRRVTPVWNFFLNNGFLDFVFSQVYCCVTLLLLCRLIAVAFSQECPRTLFLFGFTFLYGQRPGIPLLLSLVCLSPPRALAIMSLHRVDGPKLTAEDRFCPKCRPHLLSDIICTVSHDAMQMCSVMYCKQGTVGCCGCFGTFFPPPISLSVPLAFPSPP
jgi:hypothetical protein